MRPWFSLFECRVAWRYLRARRREGFISVIAGFSFAGIALGVATLIVVMSVMNGFRAQLLERILGVNGHLAVYGSSQALTDYDTLAPQIRSIPGVKHVFPIVERQAIIMANGIARGAMVQGSTREALVQRPLIA